MTYQHKSFIAFFSSFLPMLWGNPISMLGSALTTISGFLIIAFLAASWFGLGGSNPYIGVLTLMVLPGLFVFGLILIPVGIFLWRRRKAESEARGESPYHFTFNLHDPRFQQRLTLFTLFTLLNLVIIGVVSYEALHFTDSNTFCGLVCHQVMIPEYTAYQNSAHSRVPCVECHIGSGADWFVRYKLSGLHQVYAVTVNSYSRPIPVPVANLRPARETCEHCHWPEKFHEDRVRVIKKYAEDEKNSQTQTVLLLKVGGSNLALKKAVGIHWHTSHQNRIEYLSTDQQRQNIPWIRLTSEDGKVTEFRSKELQMDAAAIAAAPKRSMDCVDCHNRPSHVFKLPEKAMDEALSEGSVSPELPFIRKWGVEALKSETGADKAAALQRLAVQLRNRYQEQYPQIMQEKKELLERSIAGIQAIYERNVFPQMNVTWGTYTSNLGHTNTDGCFRCHDGEHVSADGRSIGQECDTCHVVLAEDEAQPKMIPELLSGK